MKHNHRVHTATYGKQYFVMLVKKPVIQGDGVWTVDYTFSGDYANAVWALSPEAVYACTQNIGFFHRSNGSGTWSPGTRIESSRNIQCSCIWGTSETNIYLGTTNGIYHGTAN
jgi:hypothetical protein